MRAPLPIPNGQHAGYTTTFSIAEDPISEGGKWINGKRFGREGSDVATIPGLAYGTESGKGTGGNAYDDSEALLTGSWQPDQTVEATVRSVNQNENVFEEVELRLRSSLTAHNATGYEFLFRCMAGAQAYASIVRWDGSLGRFTYLARKKGPEYSISDGDLVKTRIVGTLITAYINDTPILQASDGTYSNGSPGIGSGWGEDLASAIGSGIEISGMLITGLEDLPPGSNNQNSACQAALAQGWHSLSGIPRWRYKEQLAQLQRVSRK